MRMFHRLAGAVIAGVLALTLSIGALAQGGGRGPSMYPYPESVLARLNLTAEQQPKVKAAADALTAEQEKNKALTGQEKSQASRKANAAYRKSLMEVLNPDQQKQLQGMLDEAKQYSGMGPTMGMRVAALNPPLSDEQKGKVKEILAKYQPELDKAKADAKTATDKPAAQAQVRAITKKMTDEIRALLTPDQVKQLRPAQKTDAK